MENLPKVGEIHALSKVVTSNSVSTPQEPKVMKNDKVIAPWMFRINPFKTYREGKHKDVNSDSNGLSFIGVDNTKTKRPQPRSNIKHDRVPSASKSSQSKNKEAEVEEHHRNLLLSKNNKLMSSKIDSQNVISKVVCAMCKKCLISVNHDVCLRNYVNCKNSRGNLKLFVNFVSKFMGTVRFGNDHVDAIMGFEITPKFKYHKEHLCPSCEQGKSKRASHPPKLIPNSRQRLHLLHMDLCGPMRIASINGKRYVLVIVDDYSRYTCVHFLRSKDEAPKVIKTFLKRINVLLQSLVIIIRIDNGKEFKNHVLKEYFGCVGISHQVSSVRTPQQNGVVERRNQMLVEAARTITPYELIKGRKPDISFLHVFGALCYPKNDRKDIRKLGAKGDIGFFIGYSVDSFAYRVYNRRTKKIMETMNVSFDELLAMSFEQCSLKPEVQTTVKTVLTAQEPQVRQTSTASTSISDTTPTSTNSFSNATSFIDADHPSHVYKLKKALYGLKQEPRACSGLDLTYAPSTIMTQQPTKGELDLVFEAMYDDYFGGQPSATVKNVPPIQEPQDVDELNLNAMVDGNTFVNPFATSSTSAAVASSSSENVDPSNMHTFYPPYPHEFQWTKDHPLEQVIGEPS
nr:hypothetical protein [Tanacetum cinerariifolium]